jgi:hypothetical protein
LAAVQDEIERGLSAFAEAVGRVGLPRLVGLLALQLVIALETTGCQVARLNGGAHGAARFLAVPAIAKAAVAREHFNVRERPAHRLARVPQLQFPHAGRVDEHA